MGPDHEHARVAIALDELATGLDRPIRNRVGMAAPARLGELDRVVDHVAGDHRALALGFDRHAHVAGRVARRGLEGDLVGDGVVVGDELVESGVDDRLHTEAQVDVLVLGTVDPVLVFALREEVLRVREGRNEVVADLHRVPADVVKVEMRAHHVVDLLPLHDHLEVLEEARLERPHLHRQRPVVPHAGVDDDRLAAGLDDQGVDREHDLPLFVHEVGLEPALVRLQPIGIDVRDQRLGRQRRLLLEHPGHLHAPDLPRLVLGRHRSSSSAGTRSRPRRPTAE